MDRATSTERPVLHPFVRVLAAHERLQAFAAALPSRARVSEPALPLVLAALHEHLGRRARLPAPRRRRRARRRRGRRLVPRAERVALLPSRGVRWGSGLEPPPHLVGERARALDVLARRRARLRLRRRRSPRGCRRRPRGPSRSRSPSATSSSCDELTEHLALAGYERVDRAEERGQFAVRGGIVDVFPTHRPRAAADRAVRRRGRGDPRLLAVHAARAAPRRRRHDLPRRRAPPRPRRAVARRRGRAAAGPDATSCRRSTARPTSSGSRTRCAPSARRSSARRST